MVENENSCQKEMINKKEILSQVMMIVELGKDLQQQCSSGDRYISCLKATFERANKTVSCLHSIAKKSLENAKKLINIALSHNNHCIEDDDDETLIELERYLQVIEKQLLEYDLKEHIDSPWSNDKNKFSEYKIKNSDLPSSCSSLKSVKIDVDEKYPENLSKDSLIDFNNVVNLPPVPEDIFASFSRKPTRSSSLSSLKSMRKVKLFLQKAESSEEEENSSENEERDFSKLVYGDGADESARLPLINGPIKKLILGNIKEEPQD